MPIDETEAMMPVAAAKCLSNTEEFEGLKPQQIYALLKQGHLAPAIAGTSMVTIESVKAAIHDAETRRSERALRASASTNKGTNVPKLATQLKGVKVGDLVSYSARIALQPLKHVRWESNFMIHLHDVDGRETVWNKEALSDMIADGTVTVEHPAKVLRLLCDCIEQSWPTIDTTPLRQWLAENVERFAQRGTSSVTKAFPEEVQAALQERYSTGT